jgi:hypothetical protein
MALEGFKGFNEFLEDEGVVKPRGGDVPLGEYFIDIARGTGKGLGQAAQGLFQLGAIPIDYLFDTNTLDFVEKVFNKITPETTTGVGDITSTLVQFGLPGGVALRMASGMTKLKGLSQMTKLSSLPTAGAKGMELVKRSGYFGSIGGLTDLAVSTPGSMSTLSEEMGLVDKTSMEGLSGRDRAAETFKSKLKFGAEGTVIGGGIPLLPVAGSLGVKYGLMPASKAIGYVGGKALRVIDIPLTAGLNAIVGKGEKSALQQAIIKTGALVDKGIAKMGLPDNKDWRFIPSEGGFVNTVLQGIRRVQDQFTTTGALPTEMKQLQTNVLNKISSERGIVERLSNNILEKQENLVKNYKFKLFDKGESSFLIDYENTKVTNFLKTKKGSGEYVEILKTINKELHPEVKALHNILEQSTQRYNKFIKDINLKDAAAVDFDIYSKQRLAAFKNSLFKFDPTKEVKAVDFFKDRILGNKKNGIVQSVDQFEEVAKLAGTRNVNSKAFKDQLDKSAKSQMLGLKNLVIKSNARPETLFKIVANRTGIDLKAGERFDQRISDLFSKQKDAYVKVGGKQVEVVSSDFKNAALDTVINQSEQMYGRRVFDKMLEDGLKNGWIFKTETAGLKGIDTSKLGAIARPKGDIPDALTTSDLFNKGYVTNKEIANALIGTEGALGSLYNLPFYRGIMQIKAGAQVSKTILSPMTQIRNFTTASFFPLASGLIGGKARFKDAFKIVADDIFAGAKTNADKLGRIEDLINRGIIDQNVQVQDMKRILEKAKTGRLSFDRAMEFKVMKKLTDIYQGSDNIWKIYADDFYQGALKQAFGIDPTTFRNMSKGASKTKLETKFMNDVKDWYKTVAQEDFIETNVLTGLKKTPEEALKDISAYLTTNTIPTYSKVPQIIKTIRDLPLGNFIAFPAEILRTTSNIISLGTRELTSSNPLIRQMGARRLVGVSTVLGGIGTVVKETAQYVTGVDNETLNSFQRSFAPSYQKNSTLIPLTAPDADGKFKYYNFSYSNPYDALVAPVNGILGAYADGTLNKDTQGTIFMNAMFSGIVGDDGKRKGAIAEFITPFVTESIGTERITDVAPIGRGGVTRSGKEVYYRNDPTSVKFSKSLAHVFEGLTPGAFTSAQRIWDGATGRFTDYGTAKDSKAEFAALLSGVRIEEAKPLASMPFIITSFGKDKRQINDEFNSRAYSARTSPEEKLGAFKEAVVDNFKNQQALYNVIQDAKKLGVSEYKIKDILEKRLTKSDVRNIFNGDFKAPSFSREAFDSLFERMKNEDPAAAYKSRRDNDTVMDLFKDIKNSVNKFNLKRGVGELDNYLEDLLTPKTIRARQLSEPLSITPAPRTAAPRVELDSGITGAPVAVINQNQGAQNLASLPLGQRYNILPSSLEKSEFLDRIV